MDETVAGESRSESASAASPDAGTTTSQVSLENPSLEQLDQLFTTGTVELPPAQDEKKESNESAGAPKETETEPAKPEEQATTAAKETETEPAKPAEDQVTTAETTPADDELPLAERPRLKDPTDQAIAALKKAGDASGNPISWAEAERRVTEGRQKPEEVVAVPNLQEQADTLASEVTTIKARLEELGEEGGFMSPEISKLNIELAEKTSDLKLIQRDLVEQQRTQEATQEAMRAQTREARAASRSSAIERYPDLANKSSKLSVAVAKRIEDMKKPTHPDHALLYADNCPLAIAMMVADENGVAPAPKKASSTSASTAVAPAKVASPATPGAKAPGAQPENTLPEGATGTVEYLRKEASLEELDRFFGAGDNELNLLASASS